MSCCLYLSCWKVHIWLALLFCSQNIMAQGRGRKERLWLFVCFVLFELLIFHILYGLSSFLYFTDNLPVNCNQHNIYINKYTHTHTCWYNNQNLYLNAETDAGYVRRKIKSQATYQLTIPTDFQPWSRLDWEVLTTMQQTEDQKDIALALSFQALSRICLKVLKHERFSPTLKSAQTSVSTLSPKQLWIKMTLNQEVAS